MAKRERLEDLGQIRYMIEQLLESEIFEHADSKHSLEAFAKKYNGDEDSFYDIHCAVRALKDDLWKISDVSAGVDE